MKAKRFVLPLLLAICVHSLHIFGLKPLFISRMCGGAANLPSWNDLHAASADTDSGARLQHQKELRWKGDGLPHTDALIRRFDSENDPQLIFYRDNAGWCPYCQKVWILLEETKIPYKVEKINMRSYGDKPAEFLRKVPNGLLPAIELNGNVQTESLQIMLTLEKQYQSSQHVSMWPDDSNFVEQTRAKYLMNLERRLFSAWCGLVFRPSTGLQSRQLFEQCLDKVNYELEVEEGPWFLSYLSIVDLTYISHIERMCASVPYWRGFKVRGDGRWPAIERWMNAFEQRPSYMATKSDYYTHVKDIPPQYGPAYSAPGSETMAATIDGLDGSWNLPLPAFAANDVEPVSADIDPGEEAARHEAAYALTRNFEAVVKFALRGSGTPGWKQFQAPLSDPYAKPDNSLQSNVDHIIRLVVHALLHGYTNIDSVALITAMQEDRAYHSDATVRTRLQLCLAYLRDRVGVPRDMSYPAARQLRAHLNWAADLLPQVVE